VIFKIKIPALKNEMFKMNDLNYQSTQTT